LIGWIADAAPTRYKITTNLYGITLLEKRFERLSTGY